MILTGEAVTSRMNSNAKSYMTLGYVEDIDTTINELCNVTIEDVNDCLREYLDLSKCSVSVIGDVPDSEINILKKEWRTRK